MDKSLSEQVPYHQPTFQDQPIAGGRLGVGLSECLSSKMLSDLELPSSDCKLAMPTCLFCLRDGEVDTLTFTDEHLFPAALGGNLVIKDGSCGGCNHGSSRFEQALATELTPIRVLLQIPDRYGKVPNTIATIVAPSETYKGHVQSDGKVVLTPSVTRETNDKGEPEAIYRFLTDAGKEKLRAKAKNKGQRLIEMGPGDPVNVEVRFGGDLEVIGSEAGLRTVAKIAYMGLAHLAGVRIAANDAFREVRQFVLEGTPQGVARFFVNTNYFKACQQGPHQHSITIAARRDIHRVDAIVRLFGELAYFVVLSDHYDGADFLNTLVYDAHRAQENGMLFAHFQAEVLQTEDVRTSKETVWDDLEYFGTSFCEFLDRALEKRGIRNLGKINAPG